MIYVLMSQRAHGVTTSPFLRWCCSHCTQSPTVFVLAGASKQRARNASSEWPKKSTKETGLELDTVGSVVINQAKLTSESRVKNEDLIMVIIGNKILNRGLDFPCSSTSWLFLVLYLHLLCSSKNRHPQPPWRPLRLSAQREGLSAVKNCSRGSLYIIQNHGGVCPLMAKHNSNTMRDCPVKNLTSGAEEVKDE